MGAAGARRRRGVQVADAAATKSAAGLKKFAVTAQPAVRKVIEEQLGADGTAMLNAMLADIDKASK